MDEVAAAVGADPVEFRLRHLKGPRDIAVIKAAAEGPAGRRAPSPRRDQTGNNVSGRGIAYAQRNGTVVRGRSPRSTSTARPARSGRASSRSRMIAG